MNNKKLLVALVGALALAGTALAAPRHHGPGGPGPGHHHLAPGWHQGGHGWHYGPRPWCPPPPPPPPPPCRRRWW